MKVELVILVYLVVINIIGIMLMGIDKGKAIRQAWRIPEKAFFIIALLGGSLGCWAGMYLFRHKTKHWYFVVGMPLILALQIMVGVFFLGKIIPAIF